MAVPQGQCTGVVDETDLESNEKCDNTSTTNITCTYVPQPQSGDDASAR
eukprot:COSAG01_NODE_45224_length_411_cov_0.977564_1_plen_48_part_10